MAKTLSNNGIVLNQIIYPQQVSQSIDALTGADDYDITISGSFTVTGSTSIDGNVTVDGAITMEGNVVAPNLTDTAQSDVVTYNPINGQFYYTSSDSISPATASNAISASYAATASYVENAQTASYVATASWAFNAVTASYIQNAQTASYVTLAQTASYVTLAQTASYVATASWAFNAVTASYVANAQTASYVLNAVSASYAATASYVANAQTASYVTLAQTASYVNQAVSASYATTASYAVSSSAANSAISASYSTTASFAQNTTSASYAVSASHADSSNTASYAIFASASLIANAPDKQDFLLYKNTFFANDGVKDISTALTELGSSQGSVLYIGPGTYSGSDISITTPNISLNAPESGAGPGSTITQLSGTRGITISGASVIRIRLNNMQLGTNGLTISGTLGRHRIYNCQLPQITFTGATTDFIYFDKCDIGNITIPNTFAGVVYILNSTISGTITNNAPLGSQQLIISNTTGIPSSFSAYYNAGIVYNTLNETLVSATQLTASNAKITGSLFGTASYAMQTATASYVTTAQTASYVTLAQTASYVNQAVSASYATTSSYITLAQTASYVATASYANNSTTASYALTASYLEGYISPFPFTGSAQITGSLGVTGSATVNGDLVVNGTASFNVFHTIYNTSSVIYASGSTKFGDTSDDTHQFTGSLYVSGSVTADTFTGTASYATQAVSASYAITASYATTSLSASHAITASYALTALSASYAATSSLSERTTQTDILAINQTGFTIEKGMVVRITGSNNSSDIPRITTASYETDGVSANTLGIATQQITNGSQGFVITEGVLTGIDTTNYISGQLIYLGASGAITGSAPHAPFHAVRLGQVIRQQSNNGSIHVRVDNGYELGELHDILDSTTTASYGDMLIKSGSVWTNSKQLTGSYGLTGSLNATSLTGSLLGTASYATQAATASYVVTAQTASYVLNAVSASFASTASYVNQLNQTVNISGSLNATGSVNIYKSGSSPLVVSGSQGPLFEVTDAVSGSLWTIYTGSTPIFDVSSDRTMTLSGSATITGSLNVQNGITGSLLGTASYATQAATASYVVTAQTASYVLNAVSASFASTASYVANAVSASFASTASYVNQLNQTVNISGSLNATGSVNIYNSGSTVLSISGSTGPLISVTDSISGALLTVATGSTNILVVDSSLVTTITGSLNVQNGVTASLFGTSSWATNAVTASYVANAQTASYVVTANTASYVLNAVSASFASTASYVANAQTASYVAQAVSASFASTASYVNQLNQTVNISGSINATGNVNLYKSGSTVFAVSGSNGVLFDVEDAVSGSLFTVWTGSTPILQVNSGLTTVITGSLDVQSGITGSLFGTASYAIQAATASFVTSAQTASYVLNAVSASFASTASYVNPLVQAVKLTGSLHVTSSLSQLSSSISIAVPSGSTNQDYNIPITKYKQFSYLTTTRPVYQDDYINLGYDSSGNDFEMDINTDPTSGRVQVHAFCTTAPSVTATSDLIVASVTTDIYPNGIGSDSRLEITVHAGLDPNYPFYKITAFRSNTTYGGNISVLVERYFPNN